MPMHKRPISTISTDQNTLYGPKRIFLFFIRINDRWNGVKNGIVTPNERVFDQVDKTTALYSPHYP